MNQTTGMSLEDLLRQKSAPLPLMPESLKRIDEPEAEEQSIIEASQNEKLTNTESPKDMAQKFFQKGVKSLKAKQPFDAIPYLYAAWALDENCLKAANNLVIAFWQLKCPDLAMKTVTKVLSIDPGNATAQSHHKFLRSRLNDEQ